jgi:hypothetical protein
MGFERKVQRSKESLTKMDLRQGLRVTKSIAFRMMMVKIIIGLCDDFLLVTRTPKPYLYCSYICNIETLKLFMRYLQKKLFKFKKNKFLIQ